MVDIQGKVFKLNLFALCSGGVSAELDPNKTNCLNFSKSQRQIVS